MKTFLFSYSWDGGRYSLQVPADTLAEAEGRVRRMSFATYDGVLMFTVPVPGGSSGLRIWRWWRSFRERIALPE